MTRDSKESVLSRWSRRKLEADQLAPANDDPVSQNGQSEASLSATQAADEAEKPLLTDADMPDIESLDEDSDFSGFMSAGVSDELRNLALRKLFKAPGFNIRDGLDEYDEDYTYFEKLGDIVTCDMKHQIEMKEKKLREEQALEAANADNEEIDEAAEIDAEDLATQAAAEDESETESDEQAEVVAQAGPESRPGKESVNEQ